MSVLKVHLLSHFKDKPFICSKCSGTFAHKKTMVRHWRNCKGKISKFAQYGRKRVSGSRTVISLTLQDLEDPLRMQKYYTVTQIDDNTKDSTNQDQDLVTKEENEEISSWKTTSNYPHALHHTPVKGEELPPNDDHLLKGIKTEMEDFEDADAMGAEEDAVDIEEICPKSRWKLEETTSTQCLNMYKCKLCAYTSPVLKNIKRHLQTHTECKPVICSKCNGTFTYRCNLMRHWKNCNGDSLISKRAKRNITSKVVKPLSLQDLKGPLYKKYITMTKIFINDNVNSNAKVQRAEDLGDYKINNSTHPDEADSEEFSVKSEFSDSTTKRMTKKVFKCKFCDYTNAFLCNLKTHLQSHFTVKPFACSKCNSRFTQQSIMQKHLRKCNGKISRHAITTMKSPSSKRVLSWTLQDLKDPLKIEKCYTMIEVEAKDNDKDAAEEIEEICPKSPTKRVPLFHCKLCTYTNKYICLIKAHLISHSKDKPFSCSKCGSTFGQRFYMQSHLRNCNGEVARSNGPPPKRRNVISLTLQDLKDPSKMKQYYTVSEIEVPNKLQKPRKKTSILASSRFKCKLCAFTTAYYANIRRHLRQTHSTHRPFACSKCERGFGSNNDLQCHLRICKGKFNETRGRAKHIISLNLQDVMDPLKIKDYFTVIRIDGNSVGSNQGKSEDVNAPELENEEISQELGTKQRKMTSNCFNAVRFKCKLCAFTSAFKTNLKRHLQTHTKHKPFACSKCNGTFAQRVTWMRHWQICNGEVMKSARSEEKASKEEIALQDLKDCR